MCRGKPKYLDRKEVMHKRMAYIRLPIGWAIYWQFRMVDKYTMRKAQELMLSAGFNEFNCDIFVLRQCEMYTSATIPCECRECLHNITDHTPPIHILSSEVYNAREKTGFYWK